MWIFQRFVFTFGDGKHGHFMALAEVEAGRADQVADVFNEQNAVIVKRQTRRGVSDHLCVKVATFTGVDLNGGRACGANTGSIVHRLLVTFNNGARHAIFQLHQRFGQQRGFTGARA